MPSATMGMGRVWDSEYDRPTGNDNSAILSINGSIPGTSSQFHFSVPAIWRNVDFPPLRFQMSDAQHTELEKLIRQPGQLLKALSHLIKSQNLPGLAQFIDWFFMVARVAILKEVIRQLKLPAPPPPPPPPPENECCV